MEPSGAQIGMLADLLKSEGAAVIHLPYTQAFQRIYAEFKRRASIELDLKQASPPPACAGV